MKIQILVDNPNSWIIPYSKNLTEILKKRGFDVKLIHNHQEVTKGNVLCLLACEKIYKYLDRNKYNLVIHESELPKGKGWSPLTWQILEGKNKIPITLFEAAEGVDSGAIYFQDYIMLDGHELNDEIKHKQGIKTIELILQFFDCYPEIKSEIQQGEESFYLKRTPQDSKLDINQNISSQFNLLRVCDNERYPAFFIKGNKKYILKIYEG